MTQEVTTINGIEIMTVNHNGEAYVAVKPICDALGVDFNSQRSKIINDEFLSPTVAIIATVAADSKERDMFALPFRYVFGWLATINPGKVTPDAREAVCRYRRECYEVLFDHFVGRLQNVELANQQERNLMRSIDETIALEKESREHRKELEKQLEKLRAERLNPQPQLF